jgi:RNA polymerase sigma-70 factor (ECF subfamily)
LSTGTQTAALVVAVLNGEEQAFAALVRAHLRAAYLTALSIVRRPSDAEDVIQVAFLQAFERLESCREPARFSGWLRRIVQNTALNWIDRRSYRETTATDVEHHGREPVVGDMLLKARLIEALERLPSAECEVVLLHDLEGWTHAEIAEAMDISEVMSRQHLFVARRKLRQQLAMVKGKEAEHGT